MAPTIAILDDEPVRIDAMLPLLALHFPGHAVATFDNAPDMIEWFHDHLDECVLICLDHDLGPDRERNGRMFDPGIGRDVADCMAEHRPVCPVIIHTTNSLAAPGMELTLQDSGWDCSRVVPYDNTTWIREAWIETVKQCLAPG